LNQIRTWLANGNTIRLEADQRPGHPGNSLPQGNVEFCGDTIPDKSGQITVLPLDDADPFIDIECMVVTGSFDPNDKLVQPAGLGDDDHFIAATDALEYKIRFQNTGTDTAFLVVIRDTLAPYLDLSTLRIGATSHPATFTVFGANVLEWRFANILLPDSNTNEPESHGFVKFKINQMPGNPLGTVIENRAGIVFDFNVPVITNTTFNTIGDMSQLVNTSILKNYAEKVGVISYPNPFSNETTFEISGIAAGGVIQLELYNTIGQRVKVVSAVASKPFTLNRNGLSNGLYFYQVLKGKELLVAGKLVIQ